MAELVQNAIFFPKENIILNSIEEDDRPCHLLEDGKVIAIGGGLKYAQRVPIQLFSDMLDDGRLQEWSLTSEETIETYYNKLLRWSGKGDRFGLYKDMSTDELQEDLLLQKIFGMETVRDMIVASVINYILEKRKTQNA